MEVDSMGFTRIGENLYKCTKCSAEVESGIMRISSHWFYCTGAKPWPLDPKFKWPAVIEVSSSFGLTVAQILDIHKRTGNLIYTTNEEVEIFPIDPNAPKNTAQDWVNKGYKLVVIGAGDDVRGIRRSLMNCYLDGGLVVLGGLGSPTFSPELHKTIDKLGLDLTPELELAKSLPDMFDAAVKELSQQIYVKEDNRNSSHRVHPREQKNRERYMKKRR
jgi:hypothetical protein